MKSSQNNPIDVNIIVECVKNSLEDDKAEDVVVIDLMGKTSIADDSSFSLVFFKPCHSDCGAGNQGCWNLRQPACNG